MRSLAILIIAGAAALGCSGATNGMTPGTGGGGGTGGSAGGSGGSGGSGGGAPFMAVAPCTDQTSYVASPTTVAFGGSVGFAYAPNCLRVPAGTTVTFSGDFASHPLTPSAARGNTTNNPITATSSGTSAPITFANPGFYAYYCAFHGSDTDGAFMSGVIWVQ